MALLLTKVEFMILIFAAKKGTWMRLLLTAVGLLDKKSQYTKIKVGQESKRVEQIEANTKRQKEEALSRRSRLTSNAVALSKNCPFSALSFSSHLSSNISATLISLKRDNQKSIALVHNLVFHKYIKHINI